jgi:imidazolonepropionase-like amidohydrolase
MTATHCPPFAAAVLAAALASTAAAQDVVVRCAHLVVAPDTVIDDGRLLIRDGKVAYVGADIPAEAGERARTIDYRDATIVPGFVLAATTLAQDADLAEVSFAFTPDLRAADAFDPWHEELLALPRHAVTAAGFCPSPRNVCGGIAALVKPGADEGRVATRDAFLSLSLAAPARTDERSPTSLMGALDILRTAFAAARAGGISGPDDALLREALKGTRRVFVHASSTAEIRAALDLGRDLGFAVTIVGGRDAGDLLERLAGQQAGVVLDSLLPESRTEQLELPTRLAQAGVPFSFGGRAELMRLSAALAVKHGLDRRTALHALTRMPAVMLQQQAAVGSLRQGTAADFAVFRGDPLDLGSVHVATWVDGAVVFGDAPKPHSPAPENAATAAGAR